jgi:hypothetical protein
MHLAVQSALLGLSAQQVIARRLTLLAAGNARSRREATRMVSEKIGALAESQALMLAATLRGDPAGGAKRAMKLYRRRVDANRRRLAK